MNCAKLFSTKKIQGRLKKEWVKTMKQILKIGGLPENAWHDFKKGARKSFIKSCKKRKL